MTSETRVVWDLIQQNATPTAAQLVSDHRLSGWQSAQRIVEAVQATKLYEKRHLNNTDSASEEAGARGFDLRFAGESGSRDIDPKEWQKPEKADDGCRIHAPQQGRVLKGAIETVRFQGIDSWAVLHLGDCLDMLPIEADLLVTDPPYGIGRDGKPKSTSSHGGHKGYEFEGWDENPPGDSEFSAMLRSAPDFVIFGANYFCQHLPPGTGWLLWDKGQRIDQADGELAASSRTGPLRVLTLNRIALARDGAVHPTQKPVMLMAWCMNFFPKAKTVLDPYMGSGSTGIACLRTGRNFVGIEKDPAHFKTACDRFAREVEGQLL